MRIRGRGGRVLYLPTVRVRHEGGVVASRAEHMPASMARFADKHVRSRGGGGCCRRAPRRRRLGRAARPPAGPLILLLHNRYRVPGRRGARGRGPRVADPDRARRGGLGARARLGAPRRSPRCARPARAAACGRARSPPRCGARAPASSTRTTCTRRSAGGRWRRRARPGARVVLHLHNYRLVCAVGTCFTRGADCTRCHGRNTLPGRASATAAARVPRRSSTAAALSLWQRRLVESVDAFVVPSAFALARLRELGAPLGDRAHVIPSVQRDVRRRRSPRGRRYALAAGRLSPEKGFADAIDGVPSARACRW